MQKSNSQSSSQLSCRRLNRNAFRAKDQYEKNEEECSFYGDEEENAVHRLAVHNALELKQSTALKDEPAFVSGKKAKVAAAPIGAEQAFMKLDTPIDEHTLQVEDGSPSISSLQNMIPHHSYQIKNISQYSQTSKNSEGHRSSSSNLSDHRPNELHDKMSRRFLKQKAMNLNERNKQQPQIRMRSIENNLEILDQEMSGTPNLALRLRNPAHYSSELEIQAEEKIQPTEQIGSISKNKHIKMISNSEVKANSQINMEAKSLNLRFANLKAIALSDFRDIHNLTLIDLRNNRLALLPDEVSSLERLTDLRVDYNLFTSLPQGLCNLKSLAYFSASYNSLKVVPSSLLHNQSSLQHLILHDNKIASINVKLGNLSQLKTLLLHNNFIVDVPSSLYRLKSLEQLSLDWFAYLQDDNILISTKHLKGSQRSDQAKPTPQEVYEAKRHQTVINEFVKMCSIVHIQEMKKSLETSQQVMQDNP